MLESFYGNLENMIDLIYLLDLVRSTVDGIN